MAWQHKRVGEALRTLSHTRTQHATTSMGTSECRDAAQRDALLLAQSRRCHIALYRHVTRAHHWDVGCGAAVVMAVEGRREGAHSVHSGVQRRPSLCHCHPHAKTVVTGTAQQRKCEP